MNLEEEIKKQRFEDCKSILRSFVDSYGILTHELSDALLDTYGEEISKQATIEIEKEWEEDLKND